MIVCDYCKFEHRAGATTKNRITRVVIKATTMSAEAAVTGAMAMNNDRDLCTYELCGACRDKILTNLETHIRTCMSTQSLQK